MTDPRCKLHPCKSPRCGMQCDYDEDYCRTCRAEKEVERLRNQLSFMTEVLNEDRDKLSFMTKECKRFEAALERIAKYRSKEYKTNEQGHFCMFRSAFEGCRDIAREALNDE